MILAGNIPLQKIDTLAVNGLLGVPGSLAYETAEIERHLHSYERGLEKAGTPSGEDHVCVRIGDADGDGVFQVAAGNDDWGTWLLIVGATDTPVDAAKTHFDFDEILVTAVSRNEIYFIQFGFGASGAAALSAGCVTDKEFMPASNVINSDTVGVHTRRHVVGTKVWVRAMVPGQADGTLDLIPNVHEYEG